MDIVQAFVTFIQHPDVQSALADYGITLGLDKIRSYAVKQKDEVSYEAQVYEVFSETFELFYAENELVFEESIVMEAFLAQVKGIKGADEKQIDRAVIARTLGLEIKENQLESWLNCFYKVCSNPRYQWVYNRLSLPRPDAEKAKKSMWMKKRMEGNVCKIGNLALDTMPSMFKDISTELPERCWKDTCELIWELVCNAQAHGGATECVIQINRNAITVIDNGLKYNPHMMKTEQGRRGGHLAFEYYQRDYPEVYMSWNYIENRNCFAMVFAEDVFDVNSMSEIVVPNLIAKQNTYSFKYPNGRFKYYYVDMEETRKESGGCLFGPWSMAFHVIQELRNITPEFENSRVYICFPNTRETEYGELYKRFCEVIPRVSGEMEVMVIDAETEMSMGE